MFRRRGGAALVAALAVTAAACAPPSIEPSGGRGDVQGTADVYENRRCASISDDALLESAKAAEAAERMAAEPAAGGEPLGLPAPDGRADDSPSASLLLRQVLRSSTLTLGLGLWLADNCDGAEEITAVSEQARQDILEARSACLSVYGDPPVDSTPGSLSSVYLSECLVDADEQRGWAMCRYWMDNWHWHSEKAEKVLNAPAGSKSRGELFSDAGRPPYYVCGREPALSERYRLWPETAPNGHSG